MDADFAYNVPSWKPVVHYESSSFRGQLTIEQPHGVSMAFECHLQMEHSS